MSLVKPVVDRKLLHVDSIGAGPDVVLLHGWGMHSGYWQGLIDELKQSYRLHCIDLPGHGRSEYCGENSIDDFVARVRFTIDSITDKSYSLAGWSMGGLIAQQLALEHPDRVKRVMLIASSACFMQRAGWPNAMTETVLNSFADALLQDYKTTLNRFLALQVRGCEQQQQGLRELKAQLFSRGEPDQQALKTGLSLLQQVDLRNSLSSIEMPVMLIGGERDTLVPPAALSNMAELLPQATVQIIKGAGHAPLLSHPNGIVSVMKAFISHE